MTTLIEIKNRWNGQVLFSVEAESLREAVLEAIAQSATLRGANLRAANLRAADLRGADLGGANLGCANLGCANLYGANLCGANLGGANLRGADLGGANLGAANLGGADLRGADLRGADLGGADLRGADLGGANLYGARNVGNALDYVKADIRRVLDAAPAEVPGLLQALWSGKVDGSQYEGECACLVGTIANIRGSNYRGLEGIKPDSLSPAEVWFANIRKGDTPTMNPAAAFAAAVVAEWLHERGASAPGVLPAKDGAQ